MRYFKDITKQGSFICVWRSRDEEEINRRFDSTSIEITEDEYNTLLRQENLSQTDYYNS